MWAVVEALDASKIYSTWNSVNNFGLNVENYWFARFRKTVACPGLSVVMGGCLLKTPRRKGS